MNRPAFETLSIGYLTDRVARAVRWSPLAKTLAISGVEGPEAGLLEGLVGIVRSVDETTMLVEPDRTDLPGLKEGSCLRLTARHRGWTPYSLCLRPIAVVVEAERSDGRSRSVAIAMARVVRRRDVPSRN
jgi:hypothetical protein